MTYGNSSHYCLKLLPIVVIAAPSVLAQGSESGDLFTYVRTHTWWVMLRNVTRNVVTYHRYRPYVTSDVVMVICNNYCNTLQLITFLK